MKANDVKRLKEVEQYKRALRTKALREQFRVESNEERPHAALGYPTPVEFAQPPERAAQARLLIGLAHRPGGRVTMT